LRRNKKEKYTSYNTAYPVLLHYTQIVIVTSDEADALSEI